MGTEFIEPVTDRHRPETYLPIRVVPLMPNFGARVEGINLAVPQSENVKKTLREAWLTFGVLFFTEQSQALTPDEQLAVASIFGIPDNGSPMVEKATSQVDVITTDDRRPPVTNLWHSDNTAMPVPSLGTMIQIQKCPAVGGNTAWSCTRKAYNCLSDAYSGDVGRRFRCDVGRRFRLMPATCSDRCRPGGARSLSV